MRVSIFANPISGRGRGQTIATALHAALRAAGFEVTLFLERADTLKPEQLDPHDAAAIVIGGDGTLRTVAGKLYLTDAEPPREGPPLLIVPMGTANLMGKHLGIKWDADRIGQQVVETIRANRVVKLDTAVANDQLMLLVAGVGIDGSIVHELTKRRTGPISLLSYAVPTLSAIQKFDYPTLSVSVDGRRVFGPQRGMAFIGNIAEYGTGFPILPKANPTDGLLDVCVLPCAGPEDLAELAVRAAIGEHAHAPGAVYVTGRKVRVESPDAVPVQVDGEAAGHTPLNIDLLAVKLPFMVQRKSAVSRRH